MWRRPASWRDTTASCWWWRADSPWRREIHSDSHTLGTIYYFLLLSDDNALPDSYELFIRRRRRLFITRIVGNCLMEIPWKNFSKIFRFQVRSHSRHSPPSCARWHWLRAVLDHVQHRRSACCYRADGVAWFAGCKQNLESTFLYFSRIPISEWSKN